MSALLELRSINKDSDLHKSSSIYQDFAEPRIKQSSEIETSQGYYIKKLSLKSLLTCLSVVAGCSEKETLNSICKRAVG